MDHPHAALLQEFRIALDKLVPLTPKDLRDEGEKMYEELAQNTRASERQIVQALIEIGKKEYPYRKAYLALCASDEEKRFEAATLARLEPDLKEKLHPLLQSGVHVTDFVKSKLFDALPADERYRIETALLDAHEVINRQCDERAHSRGEQFETLVKKWTIERDEVQRLIDELRNMAGRSPALAEEITAKADMYEEGWSIVSRDPEAKDVREDIASFATQLEEQSHDDMMTL